MRVSGHLELRDDAGGLRHFLDGKPVHAGDALDLLLPDGVWLPGRYEWDFKSGSEPWFYFALGGEWERLRARQPDVEPLQARIRLPENAVLRWPNIAK